MDGKSYTLYSLYKCTAVYMKPRPSRFTSYSEANASEELENLEDILYGFRKFNSPITH